MATRVISARWIGVMAVFVIGLSLLVACGSSDKWEGTWVQVDDTKTGLEITKVDDTTYKVADPDGSNEFEAKVSSDGKQLTGTIDMAEEGEQGMTADVTMTMKDDTHVTFEVAVGDQKISYELEKD